MATHDIPDSVPNTKGKFSGNHTSTQSGARTAETITIGNSVTNMTSVATTASINSSQEGSETDTMVKSISDKYICTYIDSEYDIKPTSVPEQMSEKIFIVTTVKNDKKVNKEIEVKEQATAYEKEYVPILDEFALDVTDDDDD